MQGLDGGWLLLAQPWCPVFRLGLGTVKLYMRTRCIHVLRSSTQFRFCIASMHRVSSAKDCSTTLRILQEKFSAHSAATVDLRLEFVKARFLRESIRFPRQSRPRSLAMSFE
jgi:hypothetical protein